MRHLRSAISKSIEAIESRWRLPIRIAGWFVILGTSAIAALYLTEPPPDISPMMTPAHAAAAAENPGVRRVPMPAEVRGFYMTAYSAANPKLRADLFAYAKRNDLNAVVIDVKDGGGLLSFMPER